MKGGNHNSRVVGQASRFIGLVESSIALAEYIFVSILSFNVGTYLFHYADPDDPYQGITQIVLKLLMKTLFPAAGVTLYIALRYKHLFNTVRLPKWFGLQGSYNVSGVFVFLLVFHAMQLGIGLWLHSYLQSPTFSLENYYDATSPSGHVDVSNIVGILIVSPLEEELLFHGFIFYILVRRTGQVVESAVMCNIFFGLFHLLNVIGSQYNSTYIFLQVFLGVLVGIVYSFRFLVTGTLWESLGLHMMNNAFSSFLSPRRAFLTLDYVALFIELSTCVVYIYLLRMSYVKVKAIYPPQKIK